jgi:hypothetical protein
MQVQIFTKVDASFEWVALDGNTISHSGTITMPNSWHKCYINIHRRDITDIKIGDESIRHCINSGINTPAGYEIWLHGDPAQYFSRIAKCIAQADLLSFNNLKDKYLLTESWNEQVEGDFIPSSVRQFFAKGEGPHWYHKEDFHNLPYVEYEGPEIDTSIDLDEDLTFVDKKFYGQGQCKSLKPQPVLPTIRLDQVKNQKLKNTMRQFGFTDILQMQYVELQPNSVLPIHKDDFTYEDGKSIIDGPTQLYCVLSGDPKGIKFKFKNAGLIDVSRPIFINNRRFVHSLVYTGDIPRGVLLAYGIRQAR